MEQGAAAPTQFCRAHRESEKWDKCRIKFGSKALCVSGVSQSWELEGVRSMGLLSAEERDEGSGKVETVRVAGRSQTAHGGGG